MENSKSYATKKQLKGQGKEPSTNVVNYTRVSTKEQFETTASLDTQNRACEEFAKGKGYTVMQTFGGTYENAKSDKGRKHFQNMLAYVRKHRRNLHAIVVYDYSRFSRTDESVGLLSQLRELGIKVLAVTQQTNTDSSDGIFFAGL